MKSTGVRIQHVELIYIILYYINLYDSELL